MRCETATPLLHGLLDGELGFVTRFRVTRHLATCPRCMEGFSAIQSLRAGLRGGIPPHRAPPALAARIGAALAREEAAMPAPPLVRRWLPVPGRGRSGSDRLGGGRLVSGGLGALAGAAAMLLLIPALHAPAPLDRPMAGIALEAHVRSRVTGHLFDVQSSDQHNVKPWLSARLDVSPPVADLAAQGFPLLGARLDYLGGHPAAAIVYGQGEHVITLFAWAATGAAQASAPGDGSPHQEARQGFNLIGWRRGGIMFCAVSDIGMPALASFARLNGGD